MEEVEQTKCEGSAWSSPGGREPLNAWWNRGTVRLAFAVSDSDCMDASDVENSEGDGKGRNGTGASVVVAEMEDSTEVSQRYLHKMSPRPTLRDVNARANHRGRFVIPASCGTVHGGEMTEDILDKRGTR